LWKKKPNTQSRKNAARDIRRSGEGPDDRNKEACDRQSDGKKHSWKGNKKKKVLANGTHIYARRKDSRGGGIYPTLENGGAGVYHRGREKASGCFQGRKGRLSKKPSKGLVNFMEGTGRLKRRERAGGIGFPLSTQNSTALTKWLGTNSLRLGRDKGEGEPGRGISETGREKN